ASVNMRRRISFPTSTYQPILKPCRISSTPPNERNTRSDHHPKRRLRSKLFTGKRMLFGEKDSAIVARLFQASHHIVLKSATRIKRGLGLENRIRPTQFAHPFCIGPRRGLADGQSIGGVVERKIGKAG